MTGGVRGADPEQQARRHCRPGKREGPGAKRETQPQVERQQGQLGEHHEQAVACERRRENIGAPRPEREVGDARHRGGGHFDRHRRRERGWQRRAEEQPGHDDRAEDEPADQAEAQHHLGEQALPGGGRAVRRDEAAGHGGQEIPGVQPVEGQAAVDPVPGEPATEQDGENQEDVHQHPAGRGGVRNDAGACQQHGRDHRQRRERPRHVVAHVRGQSPSVGRCIAQVQAEGGDPGRGRQGENGVAHPPGRQSLASGDQPCLTQPGEAEADPEEVQRNTRRGHRLSPWIPVTPRADVAGPLAPPVAAQAERPFENMVATRRGGVFTASRTSPVAATRKTRRGAGKINSGDRRGVVYLRW